MYKLSNFVLILLLLFTVSLATVSKSTLKSSTMLKAKITSCLNSNLKCENKSCCANLSCSRTCPRPSS